MVQLEMGIHCVKFATLAHLASVILCGIFTASCLKIVLAFSYVLKKLHLVELLV